MRLLRRSSGNRALRIAGAIYVPATLALGETRERLPVPRGIVAAGASRPPRRGSRRPSTRW